MALFDPTDFTSAGTLSGLNPNVRPALKEIDEAMKEGDAKYGLDAWKDSGKLKVGDHVKAITRHVRRWTMGEKYDRDSKRRALAHVAARAIIALQREIDEDAKAHAQALTRGNES